MKIQSQRQHNKANAMYKNDDVYDDDDVIMMMRGLEHRFKVDTQSSRLTHSH